MFTSNKPILLMGMSHVGALDRALTDDERKLVDVLDLNANSQVFDQLENTIHYSSLKRNSYKFVFLSIRGTYHNVFGLIENPVRLSVGDPVKGVIPPHDESDLRHFVPEHMMRAHFRQTLQDLSFSHFPKLVEHFSGAKVYHISSPPPCGDAAHIRAHPGIFRPRLHLGVTPSSLRRKFYDIHTELYSVGCAKAGIGFVRIPAGTTGEDGLMKREYWNNDPTHANAAYGRLVLEQIAEITGLLK